MSSFERDPRYDQRRASSRTTWALLAALAVIILGGFLFYNSGGHGPDKTASTSSTSVVRSTPAPTPPSPAPQPGPANAR